ncbi:MAG: hypothetical protein KGI82_08915 [Betaproteobacteria bacterium]|nr:hypothetical protein [Betaproteobacteria bacterium]
MTDRPITPREDVEALAQRCFAVSQFIARQKSQDEIAGLLEKADAMLRSLLAERDASLVVIAKYRDALQSCGCKECVATIKETPDA